MKYHFPVRQSLIDHEIERLFEEIDTVDVNSDEFKTITEQIAAYQEMKSTKDKFKYDVTVKCIGVAGTLVAIGAIMTFERANVLGTKAFGFIPKLPM